MKSKFDNILDDFVSGQRDKTHLSSQKQTKQDRNVFHALNNYEKTLLSEKQVENDFNKMIGKVKKKKLQIRSYYKYIASIAAVIIIALAYYVNIDVPQSSLQYTEYATLENETSKIILEDDSYILLKPNSKLRLPEGFNSKSRNVELIGNAYFNVKHDPSSIFKVHLKEYDIKVLGTQFLVDNTEDYIRTTLEKGKIEIDFRSNLKPISMKPNQKFILNKKTNKNLLITYSDNFEIDLENDLFSFKNETFQSIISDLSKYYEKRIVIENSDLKIRKYSASFTSSSLLDVLKSLQNITSFEIDEKSSEIIIK